MLRAMRSALITSAAALIVLALSLGAAWASDAGGNDGGGNSGGEGGREAVESWLVDHIKLNLTRSEVERVVHLFITKLERRRQTEEDSSAERLNIQPRQVLVDASIVEVIDVNKLDLTGIPLFGDLIGPEFNGDDMTEENKVGNVYSTGDGGLFVVLEPTALGDPGQINISRLIVFNDDYSNEVKPLKANLNPSNSETEESLGKLAPLPSVRSVTTNVSIPDGGTILLGGLTQEEAQNDESQVPFLSDIPVLNRMFRGTAHQEGRSNLLILIKPSILVQEE